MSLMVSYRALGHGGELSQTAEAMSSDVSASGLRLMTPTKLSQGDTLELEIFIASDEKNPIRAVGEVVWQTKATDVSYETGVVIKHMENDEKKRFMQFVFDQISKAVGLG